MMMPNKPSVAGKLVYLKNPRASLLKCSVEGVGQRRQLSA